MPTTLSDDLCVASVQLSDHMPPKGEYSSRNRRRWEYAKSQAGRVVVLDTGDSAARTTAQQIARAMRRLAAEEGVDAEVSYRKSTVYIRVAASEGVGR